MDEAVVALDHAEAPPNPITKLVQRFNRLSNPRKIAILAGVALAVAAMFASVMWSRDPGYRILFSNVADRDGGQIIQSLQQMNIPYKVEMGGAIAVPADKVYDIRLRLASQGLPKAGYVGFELMDNQKFGISQFNEQVNYQRAVEGELSHSIESLSAVQSARVHIAMPKESVFLRDKVHPTVSVLLTLYPGRLLEASQVAGIVHLVSGSIPSLQASDVTVVDQDGNMLSTNPDNVGNNPNTGTNLSRKQLAYTHQVEADLAERVQKILEPIVGKDNVKAEVTAELDFSEQEQASENYRPNSTPNASAIRSEKSQESSNTANNNAPASGVPGALSNQPPGAASAPVNLPNPPGVSPSGGAGQTGSSNKEMTRNYEVDRTVAHVKQPLGQIKRLSAAVVVNYKRVNQKDGGVKSVPLTQPEMTQIDHLVREAIGYSESRGDSAKVVNAAFADRILDIEGKSFLVKLTEYLIAHTTDIIKVALIAMVLAYLLFGVLRPILRDVIRPQREQQLAGEDGAVALTAEELAQSEVEAEAVAEAEANAQLIAFSELMQRAKEMAREDPRMVATIIREWLNADAGDKETT
ncbi:flagellar M-ring protein FliF [Burkholderiaceae bacterium DAT-1]|nr:flagellar M-ring protein FliF [Burkholderiaceae bacterium DAT-1]